MDPAAVHTVGSRLREAREKRGASIRDIADRTKISVMALEALERDDPAGLPGGVFTRGFVRTYAGEVGLDPEETFKAFLEQSADEPAGTGSPRETVDDPEAVESDRRVTRTVLWLVAASLPIAGMVVYLGTMSRDVSTTVESAGTAPTLEVPGGDTLPLGGDAVMGDPVTAVDAAVAPSPPQTDLLMMVFEPLGDCWISLTVDDDAERSELLSGGQRRVFRADREIVVTLGDAAACVFTLNGSKGRLPGGPGQVVTRRITHDNFRTFLTE